MAVASPEWSRPDCRLRGGVDRLELPDGDVGVELGDGELCMAQHLLDEPDVGDPPPGDSALGQRGGTTCCSTHDRDRKPGTGRTAVDTNGRHARGGQTRVVRSSEVAQPQSRWPPDSRGRADDARESSTISP